MLIITAVALLTVEFELSLGNNFISLASHTIPKYYTSLHRSPAVFILKKKGETVV